MENGEQFVTMAGILMMLTLRVLRWGLLVRRKYLQGTRYQTAKAEYGWIMCNAQGFSKDILRSVFTPAGGMSIVDMTGTPV